MLASMQLDDFLIALIAIFAAAKLFGELAERIGQPAVLGEMVGGIVFGVSGLHLIDPHQQTIHFLSELGVILLLFLIGLETDLQKLISVGPSALAVAVVGVALPFGGGYAAGALLGYSVVVSVFLGAALTATSVGITARVLSDLGHLRDDESQVVLGAAVIDDIVGLILLTVVSALASGAALSVGAVAWITTVAFGFVAIAIVLGSLLAPRLIVLISRLRVSKALFFASVMFALTLAVVAARVGSALIIGAFAAGLVLARTEKGHQIAREVHDIAQFFIPIFFVSVGAAVDLRSLNPLVPETRQFLIVGLILTIIAIVGKVASGYAALTKNLRKIVIGVGMVPRGEVGLIFAQIGLTTGLLSAGLYSSVAMMVIVTTFMTPPLLRRLLVAREREHLAGTVSDYVTEAPGDADDEEE